MIKKIQYLHAYTHFYYFPLIPRQFQKIFCVQMMFSKICPLKFTLEQEGVGDGVLAAT
jgi:hypothetical protein